MNAQTATLQRPTPLQSAPENNLPAVAGNVTPMPSAPKLYPPKIAKAILAVTKEVGAVAKATNKGDTNGGWNDFHKYGYQKWEDVLDRLSPLLAQHGIIIQQSEVARSLFENDQMMSISYSFTIINEDGDVWPDRPVWTAIARARDQKGIPDDKAGNKCHTQAHKYFLLHLFKIRTRDVDDSDSDGGETKKPTPPRPGAKKAEEAAAPDLSKPVEISNVGHTATTWAQTFAEVIRKAPSLAEVNEWERVNGDMLMRLSHANQLLYADLVKVLSECKAAVTPKPPRPGAKKEEAAPADAPMPHAGDDMPGWLAWLDVKLTAFKDGQGEAASEWWNAVIDPITEKMFPPDYESAVGVWRKHEQRLTP